MFWLSKNSFFSFYTSPFLDSLLFSHKFLACTLFSFIYLNFQSDHLHLFPFVALSYILLVSVAIISQPLCPGISDLRSSQSPSQPVPAHFQLPVIVSHPSLLFLPSALSSFILSLSPCLLVLHLNQVIFGGVLKSAVEGREKVSSLSAAVL